MESKVYVVASAIMCVGNSARRRRSDTLWPYCYSRHIPLTRGIFHQVKRTPRNDGWDLAQADGGPEGARRVRPWVGRGPGPPTGTRFWRRLIRSSNHLVHFPVSKSEASAIFLFCYWLKIISGLSPFIEFSSTASTVISHVLFILVVPTPPYFTSNYKHFLG